MNLSKCSQVLRGPIFRQSLHVTFFTQSKSISTTCLSTDSKLLISPPTFSPVIVRGLKYDFKRGDKIEVDEGETEFDRVAGELALDLTNVFINKVTIPIYHPEIELDDRIRGQKFQGLLLYIKNMHLLKIMAHIKFVYVRPHIVRVVKNSEERTITVDWKFVGLTMGRMVLRYIPDKLWFRANMDNASKVRVTFIMTGQDWKEFF